MAGNDGSPLWTSADLDRMTPEQVRALTERGELDHLLAGHEPTQADADARKAEHFDG
jgi:hypothetical protein